MESYKDCYDIITDPHFNKITNLELIVGTKCQNACKYCYRVKDQHKGSIIGMPISRAKMYIENAIEMGFITDKIPVVEFFGGDPIVDIDYFKELLVLVKPYTSQILVPTNARILERIKDKDIDDIIAVSDNKVSFSLSVDSPFQENYNRKLSSFGKMQGMEQDRDWDRLLHLSKKYGMGFHPMLSFDTVSTWYDTWEFFMNNGVPCYLLEVRHPLSKDQMFEAVFQLCKIIKTVINENIHSNYNTIRPCFMDRGMTCSAQTTLAINIDGCVYTCHRLINERFKIADLNTKEVDASKFVMWKGLYHRRNQAVCMGCPLREVCPSQCLGAAFEYWGSNGGLTIPVPSLCQYFLLKYYIFSLYFLDWNEFVKQHVKIKDLELAVYGNFKEKDLLELKERIENV